MAASAADTGIIRQETVPAIAMSDYAKDVLVDADWVEARLDEFQSDDPAHRLVEVDVDTEAYDSGHAPGAIGFNWETDLQDQTNRDVLTKADFEALNGGHGISEDSTVVLYGDNSNWFAAYTYWQYKYYGHDDVKLLDGGREYWVENDYPLTEEVPEFPETTYTADEPDESIRAYRGDVDEAIDAGVPLVDVRSPEEYSGEILAPPGLQETAQRGGHIPGARNISWAAVTDDDGTFKTKQELEELYADVLAEGDDEIGTVPVDVRERLQEHCEQFAGTHPDISLECAIQGEPVAPLQDPALFDIPVENIIENAVVHNDTTDPQVRISARRDDSTVRVRVEDNGPEIPDVELDVLKTGSESALQHGSSIGLWLAYWSVRTAGGSIAFETCEGGNTVTLEFPAAERPA